MTADAPSSSDRPPHGGHIQRHHRDGNDRNDVNVGINGREVGRCGAYQHRHCHRRGNDEMTPTTMTTTMMTMTTTTTTTTMTMTVHCHPGFPHPFGAGRRTRDDQRE